MKIGFGNENDNKADWEGNENDNIADWEGKDYCMEEDSFRRFHLD